MPIHETINGLGLRKSQVDYLLRQDQVNAYPKLVAWLESQVTNDYNVNCFTVGDFPVESR